MARPSNPSVLAAPKLAESELSESDPLYQAEVVEQLAASAGEESSAGSSASAAIGSVPPPSATSATLGSFQTVPAETPRDEISKIVQSQSMNAASAGLQPRKVATPPRPSSQTSAKPSTETAPRARKLGAAVSSANVPANSLSRVNASNESTTRPPSTPTRLQSASSRRTLIGISPLDPALALQAPATPDRPSTAASAETVVKQSDATPALPIVGTEAVAATGTVAVPETVAVAVTGTVAVADTVAVAESVAGTDVVAAAVTESVAVPETVAVAVTGTVAVADTVAVAESVAGTDVATAGPEAAAVAVADTVAVAVSGAVTESVAVTPKRMPPRPSNTPKKAQGGHTTATPVRPGLSAKQSSPLEPPLVASATPITSIDPAAHRTLGNVPQPVSHRAAPQSAASKGAEPSERTMIAAKPVSVRPLAPSARGAVGSASLNAPAPPPASSASGQPEIGVTTSSDQGSASANAPSVPEIPVPVPHEKAAGIAQRASASRAPALRASASASSSSDSDAQIPIDFDGFELPSEPTHPELFPNLEDGLDGGESEDEQESPDGAASDSHIERKNELPTSPWNEIPDSLEDGPGALEIPFDSPTKPWNGPPPSGAFEVGDRAEPSEQVPVDGIAIDAPTRPWSELSPSSSFPINSPKGPPPLPTSKSRVEGNFDVSPQIPSAVAVSATPPGSVQPPPRERISTPLPNLRTTLSVRKLLLGGVGLAAAGATAVLLMSSAPAHTDTGRKS
ncbi:MAG TPA: hypothetical protein VKP30_33990, partial [Polyangiaceae bacterium]|nr:hypothetical protein [Polyangiaceae bacterium]